MIKRLYKNLSFLLVAFLLFTSLPTVALAADDDNEDGSAVVSSSSEEQSSEVPEDEMVVELEDEDASSESSDVTESIAESTENENVLESSLDINIESEETDIDTDLIDESDIDVDTITEDVAESDMYEQDLFDDFTLSGSVGSISDFDITITDVRGTHTSRLIGNDGKPKILLFGGAHCGQTRASSGFINEIYSSIEGKVDVYFFDIKGYPDSDVIKSARNISDKITVANIGNDEYYSPTDTFYRRCSDAANKKDGDSMPLIVYVDGSGNILYTSWSQQSKYTILYRIEHELKINIPEKITPNSFSATEFPASYDITIKSDGISYYKINPVATGDYTIEFLGRYAPYLKIYESGTCLSSTYLVSQISRRLEAGKEYVFEIENTYNGTITFEMSIKTNATIKTFDPSYKGIIKDNASGKWYYVKDGYVDVSYTGFAKYAGNGKTYYVKNGEVDWSCTSLMKESSTGKWYYVQKGQVNFDYVGLAKNVANGHWYYVNKGAISWNFTGLAKNPGNGHWYYVTKGEIDWKYTGLAKNSANGNWYYVKNGEIDFKYTGIAKNNANGRYYYVRNGQLDWNYSGNVYDATTKKTYKVVKGVVQ